MDPESPRLAQTDIYTNAKAGVDIYSDANTDAKKIYINNPIFNAPQGMRMLEKSS